MAPSGTGGSGSPRPVGDAAPWAQGPQERHGEREMGDMGMPRTGHGRRPAVDRSTLEYYEERGREFVEETREYSMEALLAPFLELVPEGGRVLDWGCGSGRDSLAMSRIGYRVTSVDASEAMCEATRGLLGPDADVRHETFAELREPGGYDGIWACASLLHVKPSEMPGVLANAREALVDGGVLYCSFKLGSDVGYRHGRWFTDMDEEGLRKVLGDASFEVIRIWLSPDMRDRRLGMCWINALARKA